MKKVLMLLMILFLLSSVVSAADYLIEERGSLLLGVISQQGIPLMVEKGEEYSVLLSVKFPLVSTTEYRVTHYWKYGSSNTYGSKQRFSSTKDHVANDQVNIRMNYIRTDMIPDSWCDKPITAVFVFEYKTSSVGDWTLSDTFYFDTWYSCDVDCVPSWNCPSWSSIICVSGWQTKTCTDVNNCNLQSCADKYAYCGPNTEIVGGLRIEKQSCSEKCSDGTPVYQCSNNKPQYCPGNQLLYDACAKCGCPSGLSCQSGGTCAEEACKPSWNCPSWADIKVTQGCEDGWLSRTCTDVNSCNLQSCGDKYANCIDTAEKKHSIYEGKRIEKEVCCDNDGTCQIGMESCSCGDCVDEPHCVSCGDGTCDWGLGAENYYTCPEDCKEPICSVAGERCSDISPCCDPNNYECRMGTNTLNPVDWLLNKCRPIVGSGVVECVVNGVTYYLNEEDCCEKKGGKFITITQTPRFWEFWKSPTTTGRCLFPHFPIFALIVLALGIFFIVGPFKIIPLGAILVVVSVIWIIISLAGFI